MAIDIEKMYNRLWHILEWHGLNVDDFDIVPYLIDEDGDEYDCNWLVLDEKWAMAWLICNFGVASDHKWYNMERDMLIGYVAGYMTAIWSWLICDVEVFDNCTEDEDDECTLDFEAFWYFVLPEQGLYKVSKGIIDCWWNQEMTDEEVKQNWLLCSPDEVELFTQWRNIEKKRAMDAWREKWDRVA